MSEAALAARARLLSRFEIISTIREMWDHRLRHPDAAIMRFGAPDIVYHINGAPRSVPIQARIAGRDGMIYAIRQFDAAVEFVSFEMDEPIVDDQQAALHWHAMLRNRGTGDAHSLDVLDHIVFEDGLVSAYSEFFDTQRLAALMRGELPPFVSGLRRGASLNRSDAPVSSLPASRPLEATAANTTESDRAAIEACVMGLLESYPADRRKLSAFFTDDIEMEVVADAIGSTPIPRLLRGCGAIAELIVKYRRDWQRVFRGVEALLIDGDRVAVRYRTWLRHHGTNASAEFENVVLAIMRGGRICRIKQFFDTAGFRRMEQG